MQNLRQRGKPVIGLNCDVVEGPPASSRLNLDYSDSVIQAGGMPVILSPLEAEHGILLEAIDGLLLTGGIDYDPSIFGQAPHRALQPMHPRRNRSDLLLARAALPGSDIPVLGICGGLQLINIALGGDLVQDIQDLVPGSLPHRALPGNPPVRHAVRFVPGTLMADLAGTAEASVNTFHHQAAGKLGRGLRASAASPDGVTEAIEGADRKRFLLGVQWHPERDPGPLSQAVFSALIEAARKRR